MLKFLFWSDPFWKRIERSMNHLVYQDVLLLRLLISTTLTATQSWINSPSMQVSEVNRVEQGVIKSQNVWDLHFHDCLSLARHVSKLYPSLSRPLVNYNYSTNDEHHDITNRALIVDQFLLLSIIIDAKERNSCYLSSAKLFPSSTMVHCCLWILV